MVFRHSLIFFVTFSSSLEWGWLVRRMVFFRGLRSCRSWPASPCGWKFRARPQRACPPSQSGIKIISESFKSMLNTKLKNKLNWSNICYPIGLPKNTECKNRKHKRTWLPFTFKMMNLLDASAIAKYLPLVPVHMS